MLYDVEVWNDRNGGGYANDTVTSDLAFARRRTLEMQRRGQLARLLDRDGRTVQVEP